MKKQAYMLTIFLVFNLILSACGPAVTTQPSTSTQPPSAPQPTATTQAPSAPQPTATTQAPNAPPVTLEFWLFQYSDPFIAWVRSTAAKFEQLHPNVKINVSAKNDSDLETAIITGASSGDLADVFVSSTGYGGSDLKSGAVQNINDRWMAMPEEYRSQFSAPLVAVLNPKPDTTYGVPFTAYGYLFYRNLTVLKAAGIDPSTGTKTLDDWKAQMQKIKDAGYSTVIPNFTLDIRAVRIFYNSFATDPIKEWGIDFTNNKSLINPDAWVKTGEFLQSIKQYASPSSFGDQGVTDQFCANQIAYTIGGPWMDPTFEDCKKTKGLEYDYTVIPGVTADRPSGVSGGEYITINAKGKNADIAWEFLTYLTDWQQMVVGADSTGEPDYNDAAMSKATNPVIIAVYKALTTGPVLFDTPPYFVEPYPENYEQAIADNMNAIYEGKMTPQDGAQQLLTDLDKMIADRNK